MKEKLKILHLEDVQSDAEIIERALKKSDIPYELHLVDNKPGFEKELTTFSPDIILSDHSLPGFNSQEALRILKAAGLTIPFILITSTVSEEYAVSIMKEGAWDYILKDRLQRLPRSIENAMEKFQNEEKRRQAEAELRHSEHKYKLLFENNPMPMIMVNRSTDSITDANKSAIHYYGYSREEFIAKKINTPGFLIDGAGVQLPPTAGNIILDDFPVYKHTKKDGTTVYVEVISDDIMYDDQQSTLVLLKDVTEKIKTGTEQLLQQKKRHKLIAETSIQAQEKEREAIGKELHDNISQVLTTIKLYLEFVILHKGDQTDELLSKSYENLNNVIGEVRQLSHKLVPPTLNKTDLVNSVSDMISDISLASSIRFKMNTGHYSEKDISPEIRLMFYRIIQEQFNNVLKHSKAKNVTLTLTTTATQVMLQLQDDGIGFTPSITPGGIGLKNIINRVEYFSGTARFISSPGKGCLLEVKVPLDR